MRIGRELSEYKPVEIAVFTESIYEAGSPLVQIQ